MKKIILIFIGVFYFTFGFCQSGATIYGGMTATNFDLNDDVISSPNYGYQAGLDVRIGDRSFWMLFGVNYNEVTITGEKQSTNPSIPILATEKIKFIGGKFNLEQCLFSKKKWRPTIGAGFVVDNVLTAGESFKAHVGNFNTLTLYWNVALGIQYKAIFLRASYEKSMHKYFFEKENPRPQRLTVTTGFFF